jgi:hypothetical protein
MTDRPSPAPRDDAGAQALASFAANLMLLAIAAGLLFLFADHYAPPQHLPWKPLRLDDPVGLATRGKIARTVSQPQLCRSVLSEGAVTFRSLPDRDSGFCSVRNALAFTTARPALAPASPPMACPEALAFQLWVRQVVQPAAEAAFSSRVATVHHYGTYACRRVAGHGESTTVSQHAYANAVDVAGFTLADGRTITVLKDWKTDDADGRFLHRVRDGACGVFNAVLSPDYNAAHANHLHLDMGPYLACR